MRVSIVDNQLTLGEYSFPITMSSIQITRNNMVTFAEIDIKLTSVQEQKIADVVKSILQKRNFKYVKSSFSYSTDVADVQREVSSMDLKRLKSELQFLKRIITLAVNRFTNRNIEFEI